MKLPLDHKALSSQINQALRWVRIVGALAGSALALSSCTVAPRSGAHGENVESARRMPRTHFATGAVLTAGELQQVLRLVNECGLGEPGEVSTFDWHPAGGRGIRVKSVERGGAREIQIDEITIGKVGWTDLEPPSDAKTVGEFWGAPSDKFTRLFRLYEFRGEVIRVEIGTGLTVELADRIVSLIELQVVRLASNTEWSGYDRDKIERMIRGKPRALFRRPDGTVRLTVEGVTGVLEFEVDKDSVVVKRFLFIVS